MGSINDSSNRVIRFLTDASLLKSFHCGITQMDEFLHKGISDSIDSGYCRAYSVWIDNNFVAMFALSCGALSLDESSKDDMMLGYTINKPDLPESYINSFYGKRRYPSLEISYLAVEKEFQHIGLGSRLIATISDWIRGQEMLGCMFLTVDALCIQGYSAVPFYAKCGFSPSEYPNPANDTRRMFKALYR